MVQCPNEILETRIGFLIKRQIDDILELLTVIRQAQFKLPNFFWKYFLVIVIHDGISVNKIILPERQTVAVLSSVNAKRLLLLRPNFNGLDQITEADERLHHKGFHHSRFGHELPAATKKNFTR
jgi:hypothetical protein